MYADGFKYWFNYKKDEVEYYRCCRYKIQCPGRCVIEDGRVQHTISHNHPPDFDKVLVDEFRKVLTHRAASETLDLCAIYLDEAARHADAAMIYTFDVAESAMRKARRKQLPYSPNTLYELVDILESSPSLLHIHCDNRKDPFYQGSFHLSDGICVNFFHKRTIELIGWVEEIHIDVGYRTLPGNNNYYYLLTAHSIHGSMSFPIYYGLLSIKSQEMYSAIFNFIKETLLNNIKPKVIMSNNENDMQTVLSYVFPEVSIKCCWHHYTTDIMRKIKSIGLETELSRSPGNCCLKLLLVLPMLPPEYIMPGFNAIKKWAMEKNFSSPQFDQLCDYVDHTWIREVAALISVFGFPHSIYSHVQKFNIDFYNIVNNTNVQIWQLVEGLVQIAGKTVTKLKKRLNRKKEKKKEEQFLDSMIKKATENWIRTQVHLRNPLQFLQLAGQCINNTILLAKTELGDTPIETICHNEQATSYSTNLYLGNESNNYYHDTSNSMSDLISNVMGDTTSIQSTSIGSTHHNIIQNTIQSTHNAIVGNNLEPPPLVYFPKIQRKRVIVTNSNSEPPPLVPIRSKK